jgi:hypothetical protein
MRASAAAERPPDPGNEKRRPDGNRTADLENLGNFSARTITDIEIARLEARVRQWVAPWHERRRRQRRFDAMVFSTGSPP